ncbi:MAG: hypothetical protein ACU0C9_06725 [Paracoccaceae bacterium]
MKDEKLDRIAALNFNAKVPCDLYGLQIRGPSLQNDGPPEYLDGTFSKVLSEHEAHQTNSVRLV